MVRVAILYGRERSVGREKFSDQYASTDIEFRRLHGDRHEIDETHAAFLRGLSTTSRRAATVVCVVAINGRWSLW